MVAALIVVTLMWWTHRLMLQRMRSPEGATTAPAAARPIGGRVCPVGLEDDPDQWCAGRSAWTALDEHQLTRLLAESTPTTDATTMPTDCAVKGVQGEDVP